MRKAWRVLVECLECGEDWTTRAKSDTNAPERCKYCRSRKTAAIDYREVDADGR